MKPVLTEKDINIFTIVKDKNNISPIRQWCIDSWHKCMPNANVMIFDDSDLNNPNWKYYNVIKNDKLWNYYKYHKQTNLGIDDDPNAESVSPVSTDSIRIRLLRVIPNALYMDSDAYLNIRSNEFLDLCNKYGDVNISGIHKYENDDTIVFTGYFAGAKNKFLNDIIEYYDKISINEISYDLETIYKYCKNSNNADIKKIYVVPHYNFYKHLGISLLRYNNLFEGKKQINIVFIKTFSEKEKANIKLLKNYDDLYYYYKQKVLKEFNNCNNSLFIIIVDGLFTLFTGLNPTMSNIVPINNNNLLCVVRIYCIFDLFEKDGFISAFKDTFKLKIKSVKNKPINFYELDEDNSNSANFLKKI